MIEIILIQLATAVACYFIGVFVGKQSVKRGGDQNEAV